jgi:hypothetical protein
LNPKKKASPLCLLPFIIKFYYYLFIYLFITVLPNEPGQGLLTSAFYPRNGRARLSRPEHFPFYPLFTL